ncbi:MULTISPECIES: hypothetical protein [unclassified Beijerinckia]|uniref:helix-turn-helix transcriptional regulator n=1 Tax=unclassified Beijerinckia TaxID=2638183 RepID=UPI00089D4CF4|nr:MULTISPECIES: hypothetical protein [unclassified Beijerinckia]MDH7794025.1 DNA-binding CsgD family transcriptional regulator [Beijerinckia sp. GAS462]SEB51687.1 hypothetical protein SAMN05443249_0291 [Beijerinckia sp. 28-YEA-48]
MARPNKRKWHELDLLCRTGAGVAAIAPLACRLLRELIGADAAALFWMDKNGLPEGFFHEDSPASAQDLFLNEFERLFLGPKELNVATLATLEGPGIGNLLAPPTAYYRSNTFNLLVRASGHHHALDLRINHEGRPRAIALLFRARQRPFNDADLATLKLATGPLGRAFIGGDFEEQWEPTQLRGHVIVGASGDNLLLMSEAAQQILQRMNAVGQHIQVGGAITMPPRFIRDLCKAIEAGGNAPGLMEIPNGRLVITPERLRTPMGEQPAILVSMHIETPRSVRLIEQLLAFDLSPKQRSIMLAAALGQDRAQVAARTGTSAEALKKHLGVIYQATGTASWDSMAQFLAR